jgi:predicted membrane chloride channel (bestrophin family)
MAWHRDIAGQATEPLIALVWLLLTVCTLSGHWWLLSYSLSAVALGLVVIACSAYLEFRTQRYLEERHR